MGNLKTAFDGICTEDSLKSSTTQFLYSEIQKRSKKQHRTAFRKYAATFACVVILLFSVTLVYYAYITPVAYVDVDVNPSIELMLNRFDRVIDAHAYNEDGVNILEGISVKHKSYGDALTVLIDTIAGQGYLTNGGLVSVTLQTDDKNREGKLLTSIQTGIADYMSEHHHTAQVDVFPVSGDIRNESYKQDISPAKYLAIQELIKLDPTASVENCREHSIGEIKELTQAHGGHHGNVGDAANTVDDSVIDGDEHYDDGNRDESGTAPSPAQDGSRHVENNGNKHHGGGHD